MNGIPDLPPDSWIMRAFDYVRERSMLPDWVTFWILMAYCGAALQDSIYVPWTGKPIFPNFPLLVVMPSGRGKTSTMTTCKPLFNRCLPYQIPEDSTAESAVRMFSQMGRSRHGNSVCMWEIPELADVFGRKDYQQGLIARVTRLLDAPYDKEISRATGNLQIRISGHAVMSWMAGTTFDWLEKHVEDAVTSGGFLPRLITLYTNEAPKWVPNPVKDAEVESKLNAELYRILNQVGSRMAQEVKLPEEWLGVSKWVFDEQIDALGTIAEPFIARRQENIIRIWLILKTLTTTYDSLTTSQNIAKWLENHSVRLAEDLILRQNPLLKRVLEYVVRIRSCSFAKACRGIRGVSARELEAVLHDLKKQGLIQWDGRTGEAGTIEALEIKEE